MKVSIEILYHFQCEACSAWFSIGDAALAARTAAAGRISCPWCGQDSLAVADLPATASEPDQTLTASVGMAMEK